MPRAMEAVGASGFSRRRRSMSHGWGWWARTARAVHPRKRVLAPGEDYEGRVGGVRGEAAPGGAVERGGVVRSGVMKVRQVAGQRPLDALADSGAGVKAGAVDAVRVAGRAEIARL